MKRRRHFVEAGSKYSYRTRVTRIPTTTSCKGGHLGSVEPFNRAAKIDTVGTRLTNTHLFPLS
jgi:hypothetical protein